ncbi:sugar ABC transporter ATP-binding protein [Fictibacillus fluitans]|uniref:Ribose/galactose/methyl galactoside import ATP-binding protein n=1 Tax=Fictibacillus fluitans TaxID=3058422 RepID=A0ABT8I2W2_9BACL|nr:sugar ABC transporter ATP-binding protein [Fictibacillus sp. NE201]MDN4527381.1 sugar ABC transporter ATP-binding protein [Fictibacillus sp. NE201]
MALLEMKNISIEFPGVKALNEVDFRSETGRVHALIGANGAGKSTLMKVLTGAYTHFTGSIEIDGKNADISSPKDALNEGIQIVHQEVDTVLVPYLTVGENILLHDLVNEMGKKQLVRWKTLHQKAAQLLEEMNIHVSSKKLVSELTLAQKQMVLIARAVSAQCRFLILDEPTAPLSHSETNELFRIVRELKAKDVGIVFISHRLPEIFEICDDITVMRNGEKVAEEEIAQSSINRVIEQMLGKALDEQFPAVNSETGETLLEVKGLSDKEKIKNLSLTVRAGEIVGIAGLVGAGKTELCKTLFGSTAITAGDVLLNGKKLKLKSPYHAVRQGLALVPEERRKEGILVEESVAANLSAASLGQFAKAFSFLDRREEKRKSLKIIQTLGIKTPSEKSKVQHLSGGNQQKIAIGKWLLADAEVYIFDEPTKGVDVGAKRDIFELISALAKRGKAVLYASSEFPEILGITNRVYVMYDGRSVKELETAKTSEEELLFYSTGGR